MNQRLFNEMVKPLVERFCQGFNCTVREPGVQLHGTRAGEKEGGREGGREDGKVGTRTGVV